MGAVYIGIQANSSLIKNSTRRSGINYDIHTRKIEDSIFGFLLVEFLINFKKTFAKTAMQT